MHSIGDLVATRDHGDCEIVKVDGGDTTLPYLVRQDNGTQVWVAAGEIEGPVNPNVDARTEAPRFSEPGFDALPVSEAMAALAGELAILHKRVVKMEEETPTPYGLCSECFKDVFFAFEFATWQHMNGKSDHTPPAIIPTERPS